MCSLYKFESINVVYGRPYKGRLHKDGKEVYWIKIHETYSLKAINPVESVNDF